MRVDGQEPSLGDYLMRAVFLIIDVMLSFGTLAMILITASHKKQRLGDMAGNTTVVKAQSNLNFTLADILKINTLEDYEPTFPQVKNLTEKDMLLIKKTISRYYEFKNPAHQEVITQLTKHLKKVLNIDEQVGNQVEFLKTLIKDYIVLTR